MHRAEPWLATSTQTDSSRDCTDKAVQRELAKHRVALTALLDDIRAGKEPDVSPEIQELAEAVVAVLTTRAASSCDHGNVDGGSGDGDRVGHG